VSNIEQRSNAGRLGLRSGDQIVSVNGQRISSQSDFNRLAFAGQRQSLPIVVWRGGQQRTLWTGDGGNGPNRQTYAQDGQSDHDSAQDGRGDQSEPFLGVVFDTRYNNAAVVQRVYANSPAQQAGVRPGDTIVSIDGNTVESAEDVADTVADMRPGEEIELQIVHAPPRRLAVRLGTRSQEGFAAYRGESDDYSNQDSFYQGNDYQGNEDDRGVLGRTRDRIMRFGRD